MISEEENTKLSDAKVCVIGCGGLGGYVLELLGRLGVGHLTAVDGDAFDTTNLNRQILAHTGNIGQSKVLAACVRMQLVNPLVAVHPVSEYLTPANAPGILSGQQVIVDALDSMAARIMLQNHAEALNIPLVHGSIAGWYGQVTTVLPGDRTLSYLYPEPENGIEGEEKVSGCPSFTPALIASIQVSEVLKLLLGCGTLLRKQLLSINTLEQEYEIIPLP